MRPFDLLIEKIKHHKWHIEATGHLRAVERKHCPLSALAFAIKGNSWALGCSKSYEEIGGSNRQAWVIMSAADNYTGAYQDPYKVERGSPIKRPEVVEMRERLVKALCPDQLDRLNISYR